MPDISSLLPPPPPKPSFANRIKIKLEYIDLKAQFHRATNLQQLFLNDLAEKDAKQLKLRMECDLILDQIELIRGRLPIESQQVELEDPEMKKYRKYQEKRESFMYESDDQLIIQQKDYEMNEDEQGEAKEAENEGEEGQEFGQEEEAAAEQAEQEEEEEEEEEDEDEDEDEDEEEEEQVRQVDWGGQGHEVKQEEQESEHYHHQGIIAPHNYVNQPRSLLLPHQQQIVNQQQHQEEEEEELEDDEEEEEEDDEVDDDDDDNDNDHVNEGEDEEDEEDGGEDAQGEEEEYEDDEDQTMVPVYPQLNQPPPPMNYPDTNMS